MACDLLHQLVCHVKDTGESVAKDCKCKDKDELFNTIPFTFTVNIRQPPVHVDDASSKHDKSPTLEQLENCCALQVSLSSFDVEGGVSCEQGVEEGDACG